jgi:RIO-like serine/threonine protein kinase
MSVCKKMNFHDKAVLSCLEKACGRTHDIEKDEVKWITTKLISEITDITIYQARYALLKLESMRLVVRSNITESSPGLFWTINRKANLKKIK